MERDGGENGEREGKGGESGSVRTKYESEERVEEYDWAGRGGRGGGGGLPELARYVGYPGGERCSPSFAKTVVDPISVEIGVRVNYLYDCTSVYPSQFLILVRSRGFVRK